MVSVEHAIQKHIIKRLIHFPELGFNELWNKEGDSNKFSYHLDKLVGEGIVQKTVQGTYILTNEGRKLTAFIEGEEGARAQFPVLNIVLIVRSGNLFLCQKRLKQPFYGYWGFVSGKINFGQNLFECVKRDLFEEAGLVAKEMKLKAIEQCKTFEDQKLLFHHYAFIVEVKNPTGTLIEQTHKAEHKWMTLEDYRKIDHFPHEWTLDTIIPSEKVLIVEAELQMSQGKFTGSKIISIAPL